MASLVRHVLQKTGQEIYTKCAIPSVKDTIKRHFSDQLPKTVEVGPNIDSLGKSLASKGYLRSQKPYKPPTDVANKIDKILLAASITNTAKTLELSEKFDILNAFSENFDHSVPNSQLHEIKNIDDVISFYKTEVNTTLPLDAMQKMDLPSNLHIQNEYVRFHPETDTLFKGQTAFPKSSTLVSGIKYRKKYKGHVAKTSWP